MRTKAERLHLTYKKIKKRLNIIKNCWYSDVDGKHKEEEQPHRMNKFNLNCGCKMCKGYKHVGNSKEKFKHSDLKKKESADEQINKVA